MAVSHNALQHDEVRDAADVALLAAIKDTMRDRPFQSRHLRRLAATVPALGVALVGADITTTRELCHLLRRLEGLHGYRLERLQEHRDGIVWPVMCEV